MGDVFLGVGLLWGIRVKWTGNRHPAWLAVAALPWAILTSSLEWFVLVLFILAVDLHVAAATYWILFLVHSASMYPLFA
jgi:hypothetical protein